jgi:hypothetical protein
LPWSGGRARPSARGPARVGIRTRMRSLGRIRARHGLARDRVARDRMARDKLETQDGYRHPFW